MSWFVRAQSDYESQMVQAIKDKLRTNPFFKPLFDEYHIPVEDVDNHLSIYFADLQDKFAEGNGEEIKLDKQLLDQSFLNDNFHYVVHEFFHWLKRRAEALFYFNDDEEIQAFSLAMAWEILHGKSDPYLVKTFYPIVQGHFKDEQKARELFKQMVLRSKDIARNYVH